MEGKPVINLILDSGAYSAYTKGVEISIDEYATFVTANQQHVCAAVNLDVLIPTNVDEAARRSFDNLKYLQDKGCHVMPVFHAGEHMDWLDKMIEATDYVGLSTSMVSFAAANAWYDVVFNHITDENGYPTRKYHAFGDASPYALLNYPWYSADSTTWVIAGGFSGRIFVNGKTLQFRSKQAKDYDFISDADIGEKRETWVKAFTDAGLDAEKCIKDDMRESDLMVLRLYMNAVHYLQIQEATRSVTCFEKGPNLMGLDIKHTPGTPVTEPMNLHLVITDSTSSRTLAITTVLGVKNLLVSKYYMGDKQWYERIVPYVYDPIETTLNDPKIRKEFEFLNKYLLQPVI